MKLNFEDKRDRVKMRTVNKIKKNWADWIIAKGKTTQKLFIACVILCAILACFVPVNYDLTEYLPKDAPTKQGLNVMEEEFGYPGTARLMLENVSVYEAKILKDQVSEVEGVAIVMWLDTLNDVYQSELFLNTETMTEYYKDNCAVMDIIFTGSDYDKTTESALEQIEQITGEKGHLMGSAVQTKSLSENLIKEMGLALILGIVMVLIILSITTTSWMEPILFLMVMGVAIAINMGTNIFVGRISFLTFSLASILQLAIAMDYSVFLLHSFTWEREKGHEPKKAMSNALKHSVNSILSSGATTVVGFIALLFMRFTIGTDMGIVLAKGIVISLITVLVFMPVLILKSYKLIEKTRHKSFLPSFRKLGKLAYKGRIVVLVLVALAVIPAFVAQGDNQFNFGNSALGAGEGTKAFEDQERINAMFGESNLSIAVTPRTGGDSDYKEKEFTAEIEQLDFVKSALSLQGVLPEGIPESFLPTDVTKLLHTEEYSRVLIYVKSSVEGDYAFQCVNQIQDVLDKYYPEGAHLVGLTGVTQDIKSTITVDYDLISIISMLGVAVVIMMAFKKLILPILLIIPIMVAIFFNMAVPYIAGDELMYIGYIIVSCLQLGATVDYSILLANNYQTARETRDRKQAVIHAVSKSAVPVLTSASILTIIGYGLYFVSSTAAIADMGRLIGRGAVISMLLVLFLSPALLWLFDRFAVKSKIPFDIRHMFRKRSGRSKTPPGAQLEEDDSFIPIEGIIEAAEQPKQEEKEHETNKV